MPEKSEFTSHVMYEPLTGEPVYALTEEEHLGLSSAGYIHDKPTNLSDMHRINLVESLVTLIPQQRPEKVLGMRLISEASTSQKVAAYAYKDSESTKVYIAYMCPPPCIFDDQNDLLAVATIQAAEMANKVVKNLSDNQDISKIFHIGVGSAGAKHIAEIMSQLYA